MVGLEPQSPYITFRIRLVQELGWEGRGEILTERRGDI